MTEQSKVRKPEYPINKIFLNRWSSRFMSGKLIGKKELMTLFEAAKWAPSSGNNQPWRFVYALKGSKYWPIFLSFLKEGNRKWAKNASALVVTLSKKTWDDGSYAKTHLFDTGSAWENLALQGSLSGLVIHGMEGIHYSKIRKMLKIPKEYEMAMMIAIGKPGKIFELPEYLQKMEKPNNRKKLKEIVFEGKFKG